MSTSGRSFRRRAFTYVLRRAESAAVNAWRFRRGRLHVERVPAEDLARRFGTPAYVYSRAVLGDRYEQLRKAFSMRPTLICYALKSNSNLSVCRTFAALGAGADIVSGGELGRALAAGFKPERIVFSGVGKTKEELELALRRRLLSINVESGGELRALEAAARRLRRRAPVCLRLNPDVDPGTHAHITTGKAGNKFGVSRHEALELGRRACRSPWLDLQGISCHIGSQVRKKEPYLGAAAAVRELARRLEALGARIRLLDLGGGMGVDYESDGPGLDVGRLAKALAEHMRPWPGALLVVEPGRFLTAEAGGLLTRVLYRKEGGEKTFLIVDAAMNDLARPALYGAYHPIAPATRKNGSRTEIVDVVGPVCESGDTLAKGRRLARCEEGDLLAVLKAGAYGFSMASHYNSRPRVCEVLVDGRRAALIRRRETIKAIIAAEIRAPSWGEFGQKG